METTKQTRPHRKRNTELPVWVIVSTECYTDSASAYSKVVGVFTKSTDAKLICEELKDTHKGGYGLDVTFDVHRVTAMDMVEGKFKVNHPQAYSAIVDSISEYEIETRLLNYESHKAAFNKAIRVNDALFLCLVCLIGLSFIVLSGWKLIILLIHILLIYVPLSNRIHFMNELRELEKFKQKHQI